jgi:hypothetical protein
MKRTLITLIVGLAFALPLLPQTGSQATVLPAGQQVKKIKPLKGEAVKFLVAQLRARNKGFDRAVRDMEKMGKRPDWEASAAIPLPAKKRQQVAAAGATFRPVSYTEPPQDMISDGNGGEMIFVTYSGDDSYWDGTVYVHDNYQEATYNAVVDDYGSTDSSVWDVIDELYYPPDGGDPTRETPCTGNIACFQQGPVTKTKDRKQGAELVNASATAPKPAFGGGWFRNWWGCTRTGCQAGAQSCGSTATRFRPFFICTAVRCTASAIACI